jgi:glutathione S-transferase
MNVVLYAAPGTCAKVPMIALEEVGAPFEVRLIRFMKGEHRSSDFLRVNPLGKVPALVIDGETLTENVAILGYLDERFPEAGLLPRASGPLDRARRIADLCFCASTLHPIVTRIRLPQFFVEPENARSFWAKSCAALTPYFAVVEERLSQGPWWYGARWSAMDAYIYWVFWRVRGAGFDIAPFPRLADHAARMEDRPAVRRAVAREAEMEKLLEGEGLSFKPTPP